ncbi:hypothetical protein DMB42_38280 [Nonomuraea sp. WAC 01424]|uniref:hypothetical protein n=1 Tax=Nonomuraea sp. WAC 01424 TaxID=2203200 RepID=UPI000F76CE47|nr:hypothetical protein [Nonomuraea sp. WAC 01424]RSN01999.1 hypothetical protein DMB42_38280 [Nonomuraea sp. WAC 01424]
MRHHPSITAAISGPDNVGKTTHARLLQRRTQAHNLGPLDAYDPRWKDAKAHGLADWWFHTTPIAHLADVLACSYLARSAAARAIPEGVAILDRRLNARSEKSRTRAFFRFPTSSAVLALQNGQKHIRRTVGQ